MRFPLLRLLMAIAGGGIALAKKAVKLPLYSSCHGRRHRLSPASEVILVLLPPISASCCVVVLRFAFCVLLLPPTQTSQFPL